MFTKSIEQCLPAHFKQTPRQIVGAEITVVGKKVEGVYLLQNMKLLESLNETESSRNVLAWRSSLGHEAASLHSLDCHALYTFSRVFQLFNEFHTAVLHFLQLTLQSQHRNISALAARMTSPAKTSKRYDWNYVRQVLWRLR